MLIQYMPTAERAPGRVKLRVEICPEVEVGHRRRIYTEEKTKVVAASWGTKFLQFLAALAILHQDE